jgi:ribA/ribD-fused uncharacterized protein
MSASWLARFDAATLDGAALAGLDESTPPVTYRRADSVTFRKTAEQWGGFSNMAAGFPLVVNDIAIRTSEALYQACRFPHRPDVQHEIIAQASPLVAKMKSRKYLRDSRPGFVALRVPIMWWTLRIKLACNSAAFAPLLLGASGRVIVEESRRDAFWGAVPDKEGILVGSNILGRLLGLLREALIDNGEGAMHAVPPLPLENFLLYGAPISTLRR